MDKIMIYFFRLFLSFIFVVSFSFDCLRAQDGSDPAFALSGSAILNLKSSSGKIIPDVEANSFLVVDHPSNIVMIEEYLKMIDVPQEQVLIEARIVEVKLEGQHSLGVNWALNKLRLGRGLETYGAYTNDAGGTTYPSGIFQGLEYQPVAYPPITGTETDPFTFGVFNQNIDVVVQALTSELDTDIISAPKITTTNNRRAKIDVMKTIPYLEQVEKEEEDTDAGTSVTFTYDYTFADEGVSLEVTPLINPDGSITMTLVPQVKEIVQFRELVKPEGAESGPSLPETDVRIANTKVTVQAGQTLVIGGLIREKLTGGVLKVPMLGDIPLLGSLFRSKTDTKEKTELLIFVSPRVITPQLVSGMERQKKEISGHLPENYYSGKTKYSIVEDPSPDDPGSQVDFLDKTLESLIDKRDDLRKDIGQ